ncbi:unnamed protein product, partial [Rotaria magnacalcarata]
MDFVINFCRHGNVLRYSNQSYSFEYLKLM